MKTVYQAIDGEVFISQAECELHENKLKKDKSKEKLIKLCDEMYQSVLASRNKLLSIDTAKDMASYMIHNIESFGLALAPFIPKGGPGKKSWDGPGF